jgi:hypothetical protein
MRRNALGLLRPTRVVIHFKTVGWFSLHVSRSGCVCQVFAKRINLIGRLLAVVAQERFVPIHFQEEFAVTE